MTVNEALREVGGFGRAGIARRSISLSFAFCRAVPDVFTLNLQLITSLSGQERTYDSISKSSTLPAL